MADNTDTIFQKRLYELNEYTQLLPGEPNYEDPGTVWLGVDKLGWPEAKKMSLLDFVISLHKEQGPADLTGYTPGMNVEINVNFNSAMASLNYYIDVKPYRLIGTRLEQIPAVSFTKRTDGFDIVLYELQAGDVLSYIAFE